MPLTLTEQLNAAYHTLNNRLRVMNEYIDIREKENDFLTKQKLNTITQQGTTATQNSSSKIFKTPKFQPTLSNSQSCLTGGNQTHIQPPKTNISHLTFQVDRYTYQNQLVNGKLVKKPVVSPLYQLQQKRLNPYSTNALKQKYSSLNNLTISTLKTQRALLRAEILDVKKAINSLQQNNVFKNWPSNLNAFEKKLNNLIQYHEKEFRKLKQQVTPKQRGILNNLKALRSGLTTLNKIKPNTINLHHNAYIYNSLPYNLTPQNNVTQKPINFKLITTNKINNRLTNNPIVRNSKFKNIPNAFNYRLPKGKFYVELSTIQQNTANVVNKFPKGSMGYYFRGTGQYIIATKNSLTGALIPGVNEYRAIKEINPQFINHTYIVTRESLKQSLALYRHNAIPITQQYMQALANTARNIRSSINTGTVTATATIVTSAKVATPVIKAQIAMAGTTIKAATVKVAVPVIAVAASGYGGYKVGTWIDQKAQNGNTAARYFCRPIQWCTLFFVSTPEDTEWKYNNKTGNYDLRFTKQWSKPYRLRQNKVDSSNQKTIPANKDEIGFNHKNSQSVFLNNYPGAYGINNHPVFVVELLNIDNHMPYSIYNDTPNSLYIDNRARFNDLGFNKNYLTPSFETYQGNNFSLSLNNQSYSIPTVTIGK